MHQQPDVIGFYDAPTGSIQYIVTDPSTRRCTVVDPVLDYDPRSGSTRTTSADGLLRYIEAHELTLEWILETHPHADHFSAAGYLKDRSGATTAIGERVKEVQRLWKQLYNLPGIIPTDGSQWDHLFADGERFSVGEMEGCVLLCPGHTLCSVTYVIGNAAFVHDTIFMPDSGTARADFPGGDARQLWKSIQRILQLPARHTTIHRARLSPEWPRASVGKQHRSPESAQFASQGFRRGQVRQASPGARSTPPDANSNAAGATGEYHGWSAPSA
jgi:glyoxylase-like metal-dependent hydrolase (beta-lactamase superfamily II)